jgi:hypothetical protein
MTYAYTEASAHPTIDCIMIRANVSNHPSTEAISIGLDLRADDARTLAAQLIAAADELDAR